MSGNSETKVTEPIYGRRKADNVNSIKTYQWTIILLVGLMSGMAGFIIQDERFLGNVRLNTYRIDELIKKNVDDMTIINNMMVSNSAKIDALTEAFNQYRLEEAKKK